MKQPNPVDTQQKHKKAIDPDARQEQLISLATDLAEEQLRNGTASSQVITHYLKLATQKERLERELLSKQVELAAAKTEALQTAKRIEELYSDALKAMRIYGGQEDPKDED